MDIYSSLNFCSHILHVLETRHRIVCKLRGSGASTYKRKQTLIRTGQHCDAAMSAVSFRNLRS